VPMHKKQADPARMAKGKVINSEIAPDAEKRLN